jgi:DNA polymerase/3'-5' exonuclease PolX
MAAEWMDNIEVADTLERLADLLETQEVNFFRVGAYRNAARTIAGWPRPLAEVLAAGGEEALRELPGVGRSIASAVAELLRTGKLSLLERLESEADPERSARLGPHAIT